MKTLGIEKRSAILYVRIRPSLLAFIKRQARGYKVKPAVLIEKLIEGQLGSNNNHAKKSSPSTRKA